MKSRITMEFDFDLNEPYIKVYEVYSDDLRDQMFKRFRELFGYESNKCTVEFCTTEDGSAVYKIRPIKPQINDTAPIYGSAIPNGIKITYTS